MRILFLCAIVVIYQLCALGIGASIAWLIKPWLQGVWRTQRRRVLIAVMVIANAFLATLLLAKFRIALGFLSVMWLGIMAIAAALMVYYLTRPLATRSAFMAASHHVRITGVLVFALLIGMGLYNAYTPVVRTLSIQIDKPLPAPIRLAVASDLHLGSFVGSAQLDKLAKIIAQHDVDLLLMPGDIMDDDVLAFDSVQMLPHFSQLATATRYGAIASLGNHDLYRMAEREAIKARIREAGITLLDDSVQTLSITKDGQVSDITVVGRIDDHDEHRADTASLLKNADTAKPVLLLDHRPSQIDSNSQLPIDLQVSGHTHDGQIFPANLIVRTINRLGYGYEKINGMHTLVTSGFGFWGVPLRLGSQSEVWIVDVTGR